MYQQDKLRKLVEQIERATRELNSYSYGPEHDQVRHYYTALIVGGTPSQVAKQSARCAVLFDLLFQGLPACVEEARQMLFLKGVPLQPLSWENSQETN